MSRRWAVDSLVYLQKGEKTCFMDAIDKLLTVERNVVTNEKVKLFKLDTIADRYRLAAFFDSFPKECKLMLISKSIGANNREYFYRNYLDSNLDGMENVNRLSLHDDYFGDNTYITISSRYPNKNLERKVDNIAYIDRIVTDIDPYYHNKPYTKEEIEEITKALLEFPITPDFIVSSGSGLQLHFLLEPCAEVYHTQYAYKDLVRALNKHIDEHLKACGIHTGKIDNLFCNDICRLPYSRNNRSGNYAKIVYANQSIVRKPLFILLDLYGIEVAPYDKELSKEKKKNKKKKKKTNEQNSKSANLMVRMLSFYHANTEFFVEGYRNKTLYAFANSLMCLSQDDKFATEETLKLNSEFPKPLSYREASLVIQSATSPKHRAYSLQHQIDWIGLDASTMKKADLLQTRTEEEKKAARNKAVAKYEQQKKEVRQTNKKKLIAKVCALFRKTGNQSYVARELGLSRNTVAKYLIMAGIKVSDKKQAVVATVTEKRRQIMPALRKLREMYTILLNLLFQHTCSKNADTITGTVYRFSDTHTLGMNFTSPYLYSVEFTPPDTIP